MTSVLISGGAGYLGSILCPMLLVADYKVVVIDNFLYNQTSLAECCADPNFTLIRGDCRYQKLMRALLKDADFFIPLAAIVGAPACDQDPFLAWGVNFRAIKDHMSRHSCPTIMSMTNSGYGIGGESSCTEDSPLNPLSLYGKTKVEAEKAMLHYGGISLRFATLFGMSPRMRLDLLVNEFCYRALRDRFIVLFEASFRRNYLHVRDAALAILWTIEHYDEMKGRPYNVGLEDNNLTKWELCERIKQHVPDFYFAEAKVGEDPDKRNYICDNSRILATGWKSHFSLDDGIKELIKGYEILKGERFGNV